MDALHYVYETDGATVAFTKEVCMPCPAVMHTIRIANSPEFSGTFPTS